ncbi:alpha/beta fold hydrolase [Comamonas humi]
MTQPTLNYVTCAGAASAAAQRPDATHRMAYWEWNGTGNPQHPHVVLCVHGLTRQGRDFDVLAQRLSQRMRVVCPDVAGRGRSDWLADPMAYQVPQYAADMLALQQQLHAAGPIGTLDWVGTSMGGLIGMAITGEPSVQPLLPVPVRRLVLNDVGPAIEAPALQRIGQYVGKNMHFDSEQAAADALWKISSSFGPHTPEQWLALSRPMLAPEASGGFCLHYDPAIVQALQAMTPDSAALGEQVLWKLYSQITAQTLLLRGADSDLLSRQTAQTMGEIGPKARLVEFAGVGHAPTIVAPDQIEVVAAFLEET